MKTESTVKAEYYWGAEWKEFKKNEYTSIEELIGVLEKHIAVQQKLISALQNPSVTTEQVMLLKYIETRSTPKTATFMRESGAMVKNTVGKLLQASDVSEFIKSGHESLDPLLLDYARRIFRSNWKGVSRIYN